VIKTILLTNDDGYQAVGIWAIYRKLLEAGYDVTFVAPTHQYSWSGKSLLHDKPVTIRQENVAGNDIYIVDGPPATCVRLALHEIVEQAPDLVISGINLGANASVQYMMSSGTVGAAMEASFDGVKAVATSLAYVDDLGLDDSNVRKAMDKAAEIAVATIKRLDNYNFPDHTDILNLNVPVIIESHEIKICKPNRDTYGKLYKKMESGVYDRKSGTINTKVEPNSDTYYFRKGFPTLTPISLELAPDEALESLQKALGSK